MIQKSHIWNSFFENIILGIQSFYICPDAPVDIIRVFLITDFLAENLKANKNLQKRSHVLQYSFAQKLHYYTNINSLDIENNMPPQHNQEPFWLYKFSANMFTAPFLDAQELDSWGTLKANACIFLHISLRKFLSQRRSKVLSGKGWDGGRLNNFLKAACCMGLLKYFTIFRFNW